MSAEDRIQSGVIRWSKDQLFKAGWCSGPVRNYLFHVANGGFRNPREAAKLKRMGVTAGVSDLFLAVPCNGWPGLWIELKAPGGRLSQPQRDFLGRMSVAGYQTAVTFSEDETKAVIAKYLSGGEAEVWRDEKAKR